MTQLPKTTADEPNRVEGNDIENNAELPDEMLDLVAGGGNPPTNTPEQTGSVKSL